MYYLGSRSLRWAAAVLYLASIPVSVFCTLADAVQGDVLTMKSGMKLEGRLGKIHSLADDPYNPKGAGEVKIKQILLVDDDLRRTYVSSMQKQAYAPNAPAGIEHITIDQPISETGRRIGGVGPLIRVQKFDRYGRHTVTMNTPRGPVDIIQCITEITPTFTKVEGISGKYGYVWDMRLATSSLPRQTLSDILMEVIDRENSTERLRIVRLYIQSERYKDAREELEQVIRDFPALVDLQKQVQSLQQLSANRVIREIALRKKSGQHQLARRMAAEVPKKGIAGEIILALRDLAKEYDDHRDNAAKLLKDLEDQVSQIEDADLLEKVRPAYQEIAKEVGMSTLNRFADFARLADDGDLKPDQKVALAISGWLLGSGEATENLAVALSLLQVRDLIGEYLRSSLQLERDRILQQLRSTEGSDPSHVARLLRNMKPPVTTDFTPPEQLPIPGLLDLATPGLTGEPDVEYFVQLPPEYDPYRPYPCIVTLNGAGTTPLQQIDWWSGSFHKTAKVRVGQGTRRGYIVIAPKWTKPYQRKYEYSLQEHAKVLHSLRDACRRFSIDTDRVFLTGHSMGGDAAWDIGLAHPDLWAGVLPFVPTADKYISRYWENARNVPLYFVCGQLDGNRMSTNGPEWDRYLTKADFDCTVVEYRGRGHEHFHDEVQRAFGWMELYRRDFHKSEFKSLSMRPWDSYFWWVELDGMPSRSMVLPAAWPPLGRVLPIRTEARKLENNKLSIRTAAARVTVWLSPQIIDFQKRIDISVNGRSVREDIRADSGVILEDVRSRGDRLNPFWAKVEATTGVR